MLMQRRDDVGDALVRRGGRHDEHVGRLHGDGEQVEIATFRGDGAYSDGRHPDEVTLLSDLAPEDGMRGKELVDHMASLRRSGRAVFTSSLQVPAGEEPKDWIKKRITEARIILLLISRAYIGSDDYYEDELLRAVELHDRGEARVIPILLRRFDVSDEPFAKLQPLPRDGHPVEGHEGGIDKTLSDIAREVRGVVLEMRGEPPPKH